MPRNVLKFCFSTLFATSIGFAAGCVISGSVDDNTECGQNASESDAGDSCVCDAGYVPCPGSATDCCDSTECGSDMSNSTVEGDECVCEPGFDWCDLDDPDNFLCCERDDACPDPDSFFDPDTGSCFCDPGFEWCNPDDMNDYSCCPSDGGSDSGTSGSGTGGATDGTGGDSGGDPGGPPPDPADCNESTEGGLYCTNTADMGPEGGDLYVCMGGTWQIDETTPNDTCAFDGYDFAFGCVDDGSTILYDCGFGPGTPCSGTEASCTDSDVINECVFGKTREDSCNRICQEEGDGSGAVFDFGSCGEQDGSIECLCCDFDDPDCGDGGSTTGDGTTGGGDTGGGTTGP